MKGVGKSLAMNGLVGKLVDDIANFRIINLDCGNWSICLFHKLASLVGRWKGFVVETRVENTRIFSVEIFLVGEKLCYNFCEVSSCSKDVSISAPFF